MDSYETAVVFVLVAMLAFLLVPRQTQKSEVEHDKTQHSLNLR